MLRFEVCVGSTITSYLADKSPLKSSDDMTSWLKPYCSKIHFSHPPGMLPTPFQRPMRVPGLMWNPSTLTASSVPPTVSPVSRETASSTWALLLPAGITQVPGA